MAAVRLRSTGRPWGNQSRVEEWRGGVMLRFHSPLIKLDGRFSRIQLSDKASHTFAHERLRRRRVLS